MNLLGLLLVTCGLRELITKKKEKKDGPMHKTGFGENKLYAILFSHMERLFQVSNCLFMSS